MNSLGQENGSYYFEKSLFSTKMHVRNDKGQEEVLTCYRNRFTKAVAQIFGLAEKGDAVTFRTKYGEEKVVFKKTSIDKFFKKHPVTSSQDRTAATIRSLIINFQYVDQNHNNKQKELELKEKPYQEGIDRSSDQIGKVSEKRKNESQNALNKLDIEFNEDLPKTNQNPSEMLKNTFETLNVSKSKSITNASETLRSLKQLINQELWQPDEVDEKRMSSLENVLSLNESQSRRVEQEVQGFKKHIDEIGEKYNSSQPLMKNQEKSPEIVKTKDVWIEIQNAETEEEFLKNYKILDSNAKNMVLQNLLLEKNTDKVKWALKFPVDFAKLGSGYQKILLNSALDSLRDSAKLSTDMRYFVLEDKSSQLEKMKIKKFITNNYKKVTDPTVKQDFAKELNQETSLKREFDLEDFK